MNFTLAKVKESDVDRYILQTESKYFSINELLFEILSEYKINSSYEIISSSINRKFNQSDLTDREFIEKSIDQVKKMVEIGNKDSLKKTYIHNKFNILKDDAGDKIYNTLSFLFNKNIFSILFSILIITSIVFFYVNDIGSTKLLEHFQESLSWTNLLLYYLLFFAIIFFHEIGHATASYSFGAKPKEIGFGLYFIFPVMYTNTTNAWKLDKIKRIKVNLGGIYFQLIINLALILLYYVIPFQNFLLSLLIMNTASIVASFNPFFRYDGYWIFSDYFNLQNLKEKSTSLIQNLILYPHRTFITIKNKTIKISLLFYSIANIIFWAFVYYFIADYLFQRLASLKMIFSTGDYFSLDLVKIIFPMLFILMAFINLVNKAITLKNLK
ncbi:site-2 protease family protein [Kaistella sp.]|uniref:site-2 protease family protein n=1 Tax=Kaistella sp. TaxID=2782235 RepID=UPI0035A00CAA